MLALVTMGPVWLWVDSHHTLHKGIEQADLVLDALLDEINSTRASIFYYTKYGFKAETCAHERQRCPNHLQAGRAGASR